MPWTTPETFTAGQTLTAASMNKITENVEVLREGRPSAKTPMCRVVRTTDTSYTSGASITFQSAAFDTDSMWSASNATRITIKTAGIYAVSFTPYITSSGGTYGQAYIYLNNTTFLAESDASNAVTGTTLLSVQCVYQFAANDYIEGKVTVNGSSFTQKGVTVPTAMSAVWQGPTP